jgi:hypothetical protein
VAQIEIDAAFRQAPIAGASTSGITGVFRVTGSTTAQSFLMPGGWNAAFIGVLADTDANIIYSTGSTAPALTYNAVSQVNTGSQYLTSSYATGMKHVAGVREEYFIPDVAERLPARTGSILEDSLPVLRCTYINTGSSAPGFIEFVRLQGSKYF